MYNKSTQIEHCSVASSASSLPNSQGQVPTRQCSPMSFQLMVQCPTGLANIYVPWDKCHKGPWPKPHPPIAVVVVRCGSSSSPVSAVEYDVGKNMSASPLEQGSATSYIYTIKKALVNFLSKALVYVCLMKEWVRITSCLIATNKNVYTNYKIMKYVFVMNNTLL